MGEVIPFQKPEPSIDQLIIDIEKAISWLNNYNCSNLPDELIISFVKTKPPVLNSLNLFLKKLNLIKSNKKNLKGSIHFQILMNDIKASAQKDLNYYLIINCFFTKTEELIAKYGLDKYYIASEWENIVSKLKLSIK